MGESPDISGAWNVAVRERERERERVRWCRDWARVGGLGGLVWYSTSVHWDRKLQEMSQGGQGSTYRLFRQELCSAYIIILMAESNCGPFHHSNNIDIGIIGRTVGLAVTEDININVP